MIATYIQEVLQKILDKTFNSIIHSIFEWALAALDFILDKINTAYLDAFENPIIDAMLYIISVANWVVFALSLLFFLLQIAREPHRDWGEIFSHFVYGLVFVSMNQLYCKLLFFLPAQVIASLKFSPSTAIAGLKTIKAGNLLFPGAFAGIPTNPGAALSQTFFTLAVIIAVIVFIAAVIQRFGQMLIQIMIAPFYVPAFLMGDEQLSVEWIKSTAACGFTYALQYLFFYCGLLIIVHANDNPLVAILGFSVVFGAFSVAKALQRFTNLGGTGGSFMNMMRAGGSAMRTGIALLKR